ncbi:hypothetical protein [Rhizobium sp. SAFR-030]|uniref:hypothetical protein n=1 Tax=Rhizobium sp. SAFR-030 TaxID=3387277 RepID=UPI003F7E05D0
MMFAQLSDLIKIPAAILAGMIVSSVFLVVMYQGISLPLFGQIYNGRLQDAVDAAISQQKVTCDARVEQLTSSTEVEALRSTLERERSLRRMADDAAAAADNRASIALKAKAQSDEEVERLRVLAEQDEELSRPNEKDRSWTPKF